VRASNCTICAWVDGITFCLFMYDYGSVSRFQEGLACGIVTFLLFAPPGSWLLGNETWMFSLPMSNAAQWTLARRMQTGPATRTLYIILTSICDVGDADTGARRVMG